MTAPQFGYRGYYIIPDADQWYAHRVLTKAILGPFGTEGEAKEAVDADILSWVAVEEFNQGDEHGYED